MFLTAAYFRNTEPGWNVNSALGLTLAIVEQQTLRIDAYHEAPGTETGDKAFFAGHFYSDKSAVTSLLAVPALALYEWIRSERAASTDLHALRYWTTLGSVGLFAAVLAGLLTTLLTRFGVAEPLAAAASALWIAGTPMLGFSILLFPYVPACTFALAGFLLLLPFLDREDAGAKRASRLLWAGILVGLASWTLPTLALLALLLTLALLARTPARRWASLWPWAVGGALGAAGYAVYSLIVFGEVTSPYRFEHHDVFRAQMARGLMGAGWPDLEVLKLITIHPYRGLFVLFPCTAVALFGALRSLRERRLRTPAAVALAFLVGLLLYNAGYFAWWGGWSYAPRHLVPALPFLGLGMVPFLAGSAPARRPAAWLLAACLLASAAANVMAISVDPQPPPGLPVERLQHPSEVERWPLPFLALVAECYRGRTDLNAGMLLGLDGAASLLPLAGLWVVGLAVLLRGASGSALRE